MVCAFGPPGNVEGEPFYLTGPPASKCGVTSTKWTSLCVSIKEEPKVIVSTQPTSTSNSTSTDTDNEDKKAAKQAAKDEAKADKKEAKAAKKEAKAAGKPKNLLKKHRYSKKRI